MKNILIDLYKIKELYSGLGQFSMNFAKELASQLPENIKVNFLVPKKSKVSFQNKSINITRSSFHKRYSPSLTKNYSIWHSLQQFPSFVPNKSSIWVLTIHDLNFLIEKNEIKRSKYLNRLQKNIDQADYITTISNFTKKEIEKHLNVGKKEIVVIYNGVSSGKEIEKIKPSFKDEKKYFFSIGVFNHKKNFEVLLPLMKHFDDHQLIIAGNKDTSYGVEIEKTIKRLNLEDKIILPGKTNDSNKQWLYANCEAFLFPSLAEGFGLPVIEAMYEGKPVFLSKHTSLPEIGGPLAFYFENFNENHMCDLIQTKLNYVNENKAKFEAEIKEYANQFNWKNSIAKYVDLYKKVERDAR
jgi:glycosyltransferase involved in cell wall biosynthesis